MKLACYSGNKWDRYTRKIASPFGSAVKPHTARAQLYCSVTQLQSFTSQLAPQLPPSYCYEQVWITSNQMAKPWPIERERVGGPKGERVADLRLRIVSFSLHVYL